MERFSSKKRSAGDRHAIIRVYELPPNDCLSKDVNFDSRYGITELSLDVVRFNSFSVRAVITFLNTCNDLFISDASLACWPVAPVSDYFSEPARSTSCNFDTVILLWSLRS